MIKSEMKFLNKLLNFIIALGASAAFITATHISVLELHRYYSFALVLIIISSTIEVFND